MGATLVYLDVVKFAGDCRRANADAQAQLGRGLRKAAEVVRGGSNAHINDWSGRTRKSAVVTVNVGRTGGEAKVEWTGDGVEAYHDGRRAFSAKPGKVLRFPLRDGTIVYARKVKAWAGMPFADKGIADTRAEVDRVMEATLEAMAAPIAGGR